MKEESDYIFGFMSQKQVFITMQYELPTIIINNNNLQILKCKYNSIYFKYITIIIS